MARAQKYRDVARFLTSQGWRVIRMGKGSHEIWAGPSGGRLSIPRHGEVSAGVVSQVISALPDAPQSWR